MAKKKPKPAQTGQTALDIESQLKNKENKLEKPHEVTHLGMPQTEQGERRRATKKPQSSHHKRTGNPIKIPTLSKP